MSQLTWLEEAEKSNNEVIKRLLSIRHEFISEGWSTLFLVNHIKSILKEEVI